MATPSVITDSNSGVKAKVSKHGQLIVAPLQFSTPVTDSLITINTAFNFIVPVQRKCIVITDILASADKNVSNVDPANVEIYTATAVDTTTVTKAIVSPQVLRAGNVSLTGLNLLIEDGVWVNAKTDDNNILLTIMFYRVPAENV